MKKNAASVPGADWKTSILCMASGLVENGNGEENNGRRQTGRNLLRNPGAGKSVLFPAFFMLPAGSIAGEGRSVCRGRKGGEADIGPDAEMKRMSL